VGEGGGGSPLLAVEGVTKSFGDHVITEVLKGIDVVIEEGEFCALTGPSGSGKSTLLNLIGLLDRVTSGRILIRGRDTGPLDDEARTELRARSLGFVFQFHHLLTAFSVAENVMMPLLSWHGRSEPWMREKAEGLLETVGLSHRMNYQVTDLSGGEKQRVAVARALVMNPALVLADEPTGNLDTHTSERVVELMRSANESRGAAFLIVTHEEDIAEECDRVIHLVDGRVESDTRASDGVPG
jgi:lipoprotein-releasing system ATP-binding protein